MFKNPRYLTRGVDADIPLMVQTFIWNCIDRLPDEADYLQVFKLSSFGGMQQIIHESEEPAYKKVYLLLKYKRLLLHYNLLKQCMIVQLNIICLVLQYYSIYVYMFYIFSLIVADMLLNKIHNFHMMVYLYQFLHLLNMVLYYQLYLLT